MIFGTKQLPIIDLNDSRLDRRRSARFYVTRHAIVLETNGRHLYFKETVNVERRKNKVNMFHVWIDVAACTERGKINKRNRVIPIALTSTFGSRTTPAAIPDCKNICSERGARYGKSKKKRSACVNPETREVRDKRVPRRACHGVPNIERDDVRALQPPSAGRAIFAIVRITGDGTGRERAC